MASLCIALCGLHMAEHAASASGTAISAASEAMRMAGPTLAAGPRFHALS